MENDVFWQIFALKPPFSAICEEIYLKIIFFVVFDEKCSETCVIQEVPWFSKETLGEDEFLVRLSPNLSSPHHKCGQNDSPRLKVLCKVELPDAEIDEIQAGDHKIPNLNSPPLKCGQNHSPRLKVLCKLELADTETTEKGINIDKIDLLLTPELKLFSDVWRSRTEGNSSEL